jgi:nucleoside-diphosphate-sugar epimerase
MIAIIGSKGYIGSYLLNFFGKSARGDPDASEIGTFSTIIYLGGFSSRLDCQSWDETYKRNVSDIVLFIYASSGAIASAARPGSGLELATEDAPVDTSIMDNYTRSMYLREVELGKLPVKTVGLRFGGVVGVSPVMRMDLSYHAMYLSAVTHGIIYVSNPNTSRSMLWIRDLAQCIDTCVRLRCMIEERHAIFNLSSFDVSVMEIAQDVLSITRNARINIIPGPNVPSFLLDNSKFFNTFKYEFKGFVGSREVVKLDLALNFDSSCITLDT